MASPLDPRKIIAGALVSVVERRSALARALLLPALAYLGFEWVRQSASDQGILLLAMFLQLLAHTLFAVTTHRILLLGAQSVPPWGVRGWGRRESLFLLQVLLVSLCLLPVVFVMAVPQIGAVLAIGIAVWLVSRLSLVFPAAAVDQPLTIGQAWVASSEHQLPLLVTVAGFPALLGLPAVLLAALPGGQYVVSVVGLVITVFTIAALSLSYSEVMRARE